MSRHLRLIWALALKDWRLFLADRRAAVLCFTVPIVLASAFGLIFDRPGQRMGECKLPMILVIEDDSPFTQQIVADLEKNDSVEIRRADRQTAQAEVNRRSCGVAVILPQGFGDRAKKPAVELLHHPLSAMESRWAEGVLTEVVMRRSASVFLAPLGIDAATVERPFEVHRQTIAADAQHPFNSYSHSFSGMTLQYLLFWGMECGLLLLRERQRGIWNRLRSTPVPLTTALLGQAFATAVIALLQIGVTFGFGYLVFGVTITGSLVGFGMLALAVSALAAGVGLCVAAVGRTEACARSVFIVVILAVSMLGGLWLPAFLLPRWVQDGSLALPTTWAMRGLDCVTWQGHGWSAVWPSLLAVNLFTAGFLGLALVWFHRSEARQRRGGIA